VTIVGLLFILILATEIMGRRTRVLALKGTLTKSKNGRIVGAEEVDFFIGGC
jgi:hypothetical protein